MSNKRGLTWSIRRFPVGWFRIWLFEGINYLRTHPSLYLAYPELSPGLGILVEDMIIQHDILADVQKLWREAVRWILEGTRLPMKTVGNVLFGWSYGANELFTITRKGEMKRNAHSTNGVVNLHRYADQVQLRRQNRSVTRDYGTALLGVSQSKRLDLVENSLHEGSGQSRGGEKAFAEMTYIHKAGTPDSADTRRKRMGNIQVDAGDEQIERMAIAAKVNRKPPGVRQEDALRTDIWAGGKLCRRYGMLSSSRIEAWDLATSTSRECTARGNEETNSSVAGPLPELHIEGYECADDKLDLRTAWSELNLRIDPSKTENELASTIGSSLSRTICENYGKETDRNRVVSGWRRGGTIKQVTCLWWTRKEEGIDGPKRTAPASWSLHLIEESVGLHAAPVTGTPSFESAPSSSLRYFA
ncbi:hypothetical protein C8R45DRAFT_942364 [Mycena sanguinolenta]|nr:hypothetical protein C8R45DRAFT_942364 [Mycena sanguinolenta]